MTILSRLRTSLKTTPLLPRDMAAREVALSYAALLDQLFIRLEEHEATEDPVHHRRVIMEIDTIGKRLEATLDKLGMSPGSRPAIRETEGTGDPESEALDALRYESAGGSAGVDYAASVDPAVTEADAGD